MKKTDSHIITAYAAAKLPGAPSKQALHGMFKKKNSQYNFFTPDGKIDTSHPDWDIYLRNNKVGKKKQAGPVVQSVKNNSQRVSKPKKQEKENAKERDEPPEKKDSGWKREHALTGGYNPGMFYPETPSQLKSLTEISRMNMEMRMKLMELIPREMVSSYIDTIARGVMQFVNLGRLVSSDICNKLDRKGMEKSVEKIINPAVRDIIEQIIKTCNSITGNDYEITQSSEKRGRKK
jgi:hypothetical protein